jgi:hypothetical protein
MLTSSGKEMLLLTRVIQAPGNRIRNLLARHFTHAELVEGKLKECDQSIRLLYAGDARFRSYFYDLIFDGAPAVTGRERISFKSLREAFARQDFDLGVALIPHRHEPALRGLYSYRGTQSVRQIVDISPSWEEITGRFSNKNVRTPRRIRQFGLEYRVSNDAADLDTFYHQMYLPHVRKFGAGVVVDSYADMKSWFSHGFLILVVESGRPIVGGLCHPEAETLVFQKIGVLNGDQEHLRKGAQSAAYYFVLQHAKDRGFTQVSFMYSPAFLNDGIFSHKAGWGAVASPYEKATLSLLYFFPANNAKTVLFLSRNPVIIAGEDGTLDAVTDYCGAPEDLAAAISEMLRSYPLAGIRRLIVHSAGDRQLVEL